MKPNYTYLGRVIRVKDGDTLEIELDLAKGLKWTTGIRLYGFDCDEIKDKDPVKRTNGQQATIALASFLGGQKIASFEDAQAVCGQEVSVQILKPCKYAERWISYVWTIALDGTVAPTTLNHQMLTAGLAGVRPYTGGKRSLFPPNPFTADPDEPDGGPEL